MLWLWRMVSEEFRAIVDHSIAVPVERQPGIIRTWSRPGHLIAGITRSDWKNDSSRFVRQAEADSRIINNDWTPVLNATRSLCGLAPCTPELVSAVIGRTSDT